MQPYFVPGLGYFDLILRTDAWVVFDTAQYRRHSWMNRNRVLHPNTGWQYATARVRKHPRETPLRDITLAGDDWQGGLLRQLDHYRPRAPYFPSTMEWLRRGLEAEESSLVRLNVRLIREVCDRLGISFAPQVFSEMGLELGPVEGPGDWALRISQALGADVYVNPPGGRAIFDEKRYAEGGVELRIRDFEDMRYETRGREFHPGLSIVDVMMWCSPEEIRRYLDREDVAVEGPPSSLDTLPSV